MSRPAHPATAPNTSSTPAQPAAQESRTLRQAPAPESLPATAAEPLLLASPRDGMPAVVEDERALLAAAAAVRAGEGPVAVDAERASGYRYGQRAYLVQLRRAGSGTWLIDPMACPDLSPVAEAIGEAEWVLHAATQDLPCLAEVQLRPRALFDTELGARLVGLPRVGLAAVIEHYLGVRLAKEHSAVDWSTRPLPEPWLRYASLDVELLVELRDAIEADLETQGKLTWAREEFDHLLGFTGPAPRPDPWRQTSGIPRVRSRRTSALVRELWYTRDDLARRRDVSPGRVLSDAALVDLALGVPSSPAALAAVTRHKGARRHAAEWLEAIESALALPEDQLPAVSIRSDAPPPQRAWAQRDPDAAARLAAARADLGAFAGDHQLPVENLLMPDTLRRVLWTPPAADDAAVAATLRERGARPWQVDIVTPIIVHALHQRAPAAPGHRAAVDTDG